MKAGINSIFKCLIYFFSIFIIQMLVSFACAIPVIVKNQGLNVSSMNAIISEASIHSILFTNMAAYILLVAIVCFIIKMQKMKISQQIRFYKVPLKACLFPVLTAFSFSMFWNIFVERLIRLPVNIKDSLDNYNIMLNESKNYYSQLFPLGGTVMFVLSILIIGPIAEEFIFRIAANLAGIAVNVCNDYNNLGLWICTILFAGLTILGWFGIKNYKQKRYHYENA